MMHIKPKKWWWLLLPRKRKIIKAAEFWINQESMSAQVRLELAEYLINNNKAHLFPHFDYSEMQKEIDYLASIDDDYWKGSPP